MSPVSLAYSILHTFTQRPLLTQTLLRLDGLVPNTPSANKLNRPSASNKKPNETPSVTRVKGGIPGSSPDHKSPLRVENQLGSLT